MNQISNHKNIPKEDVVIWLLGSYIEGLWFRLFEKVELRLRFDEFFGYLTFKFKEASQENRKRLFIPALLWIMLGF